MSNKGFGFDFVVRVVEKGVAETKKKISSIYDNQMDAYRRRQHAHDAITDKWQERAIQHEKTLRGFQREKKQDWDLMSKWERKRVNKNIALAEFDLNRANNRRDASTKWWGGLYSAKDNITSPIRRLFVNGKNQDGNIKEGMTSIVDLVKKWAVALGVAYVAYKAIELVVGLIKKAAKAVVDLFKESLDLGIEMEHLSHKMSLTMGSQTNALNGMEFAMRKFENFDFKDTLTGMEDLAKVGVDITKNYELIGNMAGKTGKSVSEVAADINSAIHGNLSAFESYGMQYMQQFKAISGMPNMMKGAIMSHLYANMDRFEGGLEEYKKSWGGMLGFMKNKWDQFKLGVIGRADDENSLFGWVKKSFGKVTEFVEKNWDKILAIGQGIGHLFQAVAQQVFGLVDSWMNALDDLKREDIQEWFMRASVKVSMFTQWIIEKFRAIMGGSGKEVFATIYNGVVSVANAFIMLARGVESTYKSFKLMWSVMNMLTPGSGNSLFGSKNNLRSAWNDMSDSKFNYLDKMDGSPSSSENSGKLLQEKKIAMAQRNPSLRGPDNAEKLDNAARAALGWGTKANVPKSDVVKIKDKVQTEAPKMEKLTTEGNTTLRDMTRLLLLQIADKDKPKGLRSSADSAEWLNRTAKNYGINMSY